MYSPSRISHYRSHSNPAIQLIPLSKQAEYNPGKSTVQSHNILPSIKVPNIFHLHLNLKLVRSLWDWISYWICFSFPECSSLTRAKHRRTLPPKQKMGHFTWHNVTNLQNRSGELWSSLPSDQLAHRLPSSSASTIKPAKKESEWESTLCISSENLM